jgi:hypothetical protein
MKNDCWREKLSDFTDVFHVTLVKEVIDSNNLDPSQPSPNGAFLEIDVDAEAD